MSKKHIHKVMKDDNHIPEIMTEQENPWKSSKGWNGEVNFDGDQKNGKDGSPYIQKTVTGHDVPREALHPYQIHEGVSEKDGHHGVNYDNTQPDDLEDDAWEKSHGVNMKSEGHFKDIDNGFETKEVSFSGEIDGKSIGMPPEDESRSPDCGRGY